MIAPQLHPPRNATGQAFDSTHAALRALAVCREPSLADHLDRVGQRASRLLALVDPDVLHDPEVHLALWLHDIGKVAWRDSVLHAPGKLDDVAWQHASQHPSSGESVLTAAGFPRAGEIVRAHHERWDGSGYPDGQRGTAIPLAARALSVADTYEAITEHRPYREPRSAAEAFAAIEAAAGTQLDPRMVRVFLDSERWNG